MSVRWGIVGTGVVAGDFATGLQDSEVSELSAVASREEGRANEFAGRVGAHRAHGSYADLLADPEVDIVYLAVPHSAHKVLALAALRAGKPVLCEKPLALNLTDAQCMVDEARRAGLLLMEAFMYRFHPQTKRLVELIAEGAIGEVRLIQAGLSFDGGTPDPAKRLFCARLGGGGILDVGCYVTSVARILAGISCGRDYLEPDDVAGRGTIGVTNVDEWATATLHFPTGAVAQLVCGVKLDFEAGIRVVGTEGQIDVFEPAWLDRLYAGGGTSLVLRRKGRDGERIGIPDAGNIYRLEAEAVLKWTSLSESPEMSHGNSLGNMATLDRWRAEIGLRYPDEAPPATNLDLTESGADAI